ncbi:hypothetical protein LOTGIDRAFT_229348 [Lottia gigantea]|uniref:NADH dehydrogenase [ubiquinone] 1 beta subcomplex subunit 4 n=1 Tax=Lottia gigantea TaxID=225164 RepID=V3Z8J5_LOTGI|nr:hypothetical protein LOTGIDRAFT_229348 [Lottia gigantea]ESO87233.1 hypothetical protein LOTGIDRAFT_229348 [Lottia gigantea]
MPESKPSALRWNPWKVYDVSEKEMRTIKERAKFRAAMKAEFQMKYTNPYYRRVEGFIFDPALQRHMAMRATQVHFFKPNIKTVAVAMMTYVIPLTALIYFGFKAIAAHERKCNTGEIAYKDRTYKFQ